MPDTALTEVIRQVPWILLVLLIGYLVIHHRRDIGAFLANRPRIRLQALGLAFELDSSELQREVQAARPAGPIDPQIGTRLSERIAPIRPMLTRANLLWVDDNPRNNLSERRLLHRLGIFIESVLTTQDALETIRSASAWAPFDLIISDMRRGTESRAGLAMLERLRESNISQPVIFYVGTMREDTLASAYGITNRPDRLLELVADAIERKPPASVSGPA